MRSPNSKILEPAQLAAWRRSLRDAGKKLVATNGCFDLLHAGHVSYLAAAREQGDALLIGLNSDASIRALKGPERPMNPEHDRALVLAALEAVDAVCIFSEVHATRFLQMAQPDVYVKGGDLQLEQIPLEERQAVFAAGGKILLMPLTPGRSTTSLIQKIRQT